MKQKLLNLFGLLKIIFCVSLICFSEIWNMAYARAPNANYDIPDDRRYDNEIMVPIPQVWEFIKYGNTSTNLYNGTVSHEIPIYTYSDNDFQIPISIKYASDGYKPNIQAGILGLGWVLNAGGYITREIRGYPDDGIFSIISSSPQPGPINGYYFQHIKDTAPPEWSEVISHLRDNMFPRVVFYESNNGVPILIETESDIYHFKFGNYSGSFILGPQRKIYIFNTNKPKGEYSIKINHVATTSPGQRFQFEITTGDGYKYTFGDPSKDFKIGWTVPYSYDSYNGAYYDDRFPMIDYDTSWPLVQIESPNKRKISFDYHRNNDDSEYEDCRYDVYLPQNFHVINMGWTQEWEDMLFMKGINDSNMQHYSVRDQIVAKGTKLNVYLREIKIDDKCRINFKYSPREHKESGKVDKTSEIETLRAMPKLLEIKVISLLNDSREITKCNFSYGFSNHGNKVLFLEHVDHSIQGRYSMSYYGKSTDFFPYHGVAGMDHWGYYRGGEDGIVIPYFHFENDDEIVEYESKRSPNRNDLDMMRMGMIKQIIHPTGGHTLYEYDFHEYCQEVKRLADWSYTPKLKPSTRNEIAGGARIKKITDVSAQNEETSRTFQYGRGGNLLHSPRYSVEYISVERDSQEAIIYIERNGHNIISYSLDKTHIEYPIVREILCDGSSIEYRYTDYEDYPDFVNTVKIQSPLVYVAKPYGIQNLKKEPMSYFSHRGKLKERTIFDKNEKWLFKEENEYDYITNPEDALSLDYSMDCWSLEFKLISDLHLRRNTKKEKIGDGVSEKVIETEIRYFYNEQGQTVKTEIIFPTKKQILMQQYVFDIPASELSETERTMLNVTNQVALPIRDQTSVNLSTYFGYKLMQGRHYIYNIISNQNNSPFAALGILKKSNLSYPVLCDDFEFDNYLEPEVIFTYNKKGNVIQLKNKEGVSTVYIWGYGGLYPVAKIENATLDIVQGRHLMLNNIGIEPLARHLSIDVESAIRAIPETQVTTYDYAPLIGVASIIDPSGRKTNYEYDNNGRLINVMDDQRNLLEHYEYHYAE